MVVEVGLNRCWDPTCSTTHETSLQNAVLLSTGTEHSFFSKAKMLVLHKYCIDKKCDFFSISIGVTNVCFSSMKGKRRRCVSITCILGIQPTVLSHKIRESFLECIDSCLKSRSWTGRTRATGGSTKTSNSGTLSLGNQGSGWGPKVRRGGGC